MAVASTARSAAPGLLDLVRSDVSRYAGTHSLRGQPYSPARVLLESLLFKAGFQAVLLYRLSHWLYRHGRTYAAWMLSRLSVTLTGAEIEFNARIGPGLMIPHPVGIVIGRGCVIGAYATIFQGVTLAVRSWDPAEIRRFPTIGDRCFLFAHASVLGGITVGDDCVVAAHAVVLGDVGDGCLAAGVPARTHADKGRESTAAWLNGLRGVQPTGVSAAASPADNEAR